MTINLHWYIPGGDHSPAMTGEPTECLDREAAKRLGKKGGLARAASLTPEQRSEAARKAGLARQAAMTPEQRAELARAGGRAGKGRRKKPA